MPFPPVAPAPHGVRRPRGAVWVQLALFAALLFPTVAAQPAVAATNDTITGASVAGSPFSPNGDGYRDTVGITVTFARWARVTLTVADYDGRTVRMLARDLAKAAGRYVWVWNGRDGLGAMLPHGPYHFRVRAVNGLGTVMRTLGIAKADQVPYLANPGAIRVVLNAGHGGSDPGAVYGGYRESDLNLDIARRLEQMLRASRIGVVMLRTTDVTVNAARLDVTGDGVFTQRDELAMRNDRANQPRGDVYISLMNNAYGCHCVRGTETYTNGERTWTPEGLQLAKAIHTEHLAELSAFRSSSWYPIDRGVRLYDFYVMRPYEEPIITRPALLPSVLVESLFMDQPNELAVLVQPRVRQALAVAYFDGISRYLNARRFGLRYQPVSAPTSVDTAQGTARYDVTVTNRGQVRSLGWTMQLRYVPRVPFYDGSPNRGKLLAAARIPDGLAPGTSTTLSLANVPQSLRRPASGW